VGVGVVVELIRVSLIVSLVVSLVEGVDVVDDSTEDVDVSGGTIQEQADDIRDAILWHCETKVGSPVEAVCKAVM
jgi:hypothetical protein